MSEGISPDDLLHKLASSSRSFEYTSGKRVYIQKFKINCQSLVQALDPYFQVIFLSKHLSKTNIKRQNKKV